MSELRDDLKGSRGSIDGFSNQVDECRRSVAQESRTLADVHDSSGFEPHESCAGCIGSNRVIGKYDLSQRTRGAVERPVSFHSYDAVRDNKVDRNCRAQVEDALLNALPVENILRPSVSRARYNAEHVLHAESDARPVWVFILGIDTIKCASSTVRGSQRHFIPMEVVRSIVARFNWSRVRSMKRIKSRAQFHNIHSDLDTALRQSERSPEKAALSPVPLESTH